MRYHDYSTLVALGHLDFVEFHLSYKDLSIEPSSYIEGIQSIQFSVHAPELFEGDHILDLCSNDKSYRAESIANLKRVLLHCESLKALCPSTNKPILVVNAGGWDRKGFLDQSRVFQQYHQLVDALSLIDHSGVNLAIQTMPPFPWHFGGQSYHNVFIDPHQISKFCVDTGIGVCLDISHSIMACNYFGWTLSEFIAEIGPHVSYLHIADGAGVDSEGVQIGRGDVDVQRS